MVQDLHFAFLLREAEARARFSPLALEGAELVMLGEAEWLELRLEVDGLGCGEDEEMCEDERWFALHGNTTTPASLEMANVSDGTANDLPLSCFIKYLLKKNT